jgi:hypothetical protein
MSRGNAAGPAPMESKFFLGAVPILESQDCCD